MKNNTNDEHKKYRLAIACATCMIFGLTGMTNADTYITNPEDALMRNLTEMFQPNEDDYGCGPLLETGIEYHVGVQGDDTNDGLTPATAWRTVRHGLSLLRAGDTLWIHEGRYHESATLEIPGTAERSGRAGRPVRIMAAPNARVIITGARFLSDWTPSPDHPHVFHTAWQGETTPFVWEAGTHTELQYGGFLERVAELPGTFWYDSDAGRLYVRFTRITDNGIPGVLVKGPDVGLNIHANYVLVHGLTFMNYSVGLAVRPDAGHVTIEQCAFFATDDAGLQLSSAVNCLVRDNIAIGGGERGGLFMHNSPRDEPEMADNLIIRNHFNSEPATLRTDGRSGYAVHHWNGSGLRNHIIDNLLTGERSLWYKPMHRQVIVQGNVMTGSFDSEAGTRSMREFRATESLEADRIVVRGNTILGGVNWGLDLWGPGGAGSDWIGPLKAFINNRHERGETASFADPAYNDYRPVTDTGLTDKSARGAHAAFGMPAGRIFFTGKQAADTRKSDLKTVVDQLQPGDTLYILPGDYAETLVFRTAGTADKPIILRAHGRGQVNIAGLEIHGEHVIVEGLAVRQAPGDAILVTAPNVTLRHILATGYRGAGIRGRSAANLKMRHCTLAGPAPALVLEHSSIQTSLRDSIVATDTDAPLLDISADSTGFNASHNCYHGNINAQDVARETGSIIANPLFQAPADGDYNLQWNSPAAARAVFAEAAGALPAATRPVLIAQPAATGVLPDSAVILWQTPENDTLGTVRFRRQGTDNWLEAQSPEQGTIHGAGLPELEADSIYEFQVIALDRRGGESIYPVQTFKTLSAMPAPQTYYLAPDGDDARDGLSPATAWRTPRRASQAVAPGDTVRIAPGVYNHIIAPLRSGMPDRRITFERHGEGKARFDGCGIIAPLVSLVNKSHITIRGLDFDIGVGRMRPGLSAPAPSPGGVIQLKDCEDIEIIECRAGSLAPLGMTGGTHFLNTLNVKDILLERCISWGARYHMRLNMPPPPHERIPGAPKPFTKGLTVRNCTFVHSQIISFVIDEIAEDIKFYNNIFYRPCGVPAKNNPFFQIRGAETPELESDFNVFFSPIANHRMIGDIRDENRRVVVIGEDLESWQNISGQERHSFRADPLFNDFDNGDFRLKPNSPAIGAGRDGATIGALGVAE